MRKSRVVITGYGAICSLGKDSDEIWSSIESKSIGYKHVLYSDSSITAKIFGVIDEGQSMYKVIPKRLQKMLPTFAKYGFLATKEALSKAFPDGSDISRHYEAFDCGVIFGTGWGGQDYHNRNYREYTETGLTTPFSNIMSMHSVGTAAISMNWNLRGYQNTPVAACATGSIAIGDAYEIIRSGRAKMMIAGGGESIKDMFNVWTVDVLQALSKEQDDISKACCPFDINRSGFVLSEGAAVLCLEDYDSAVKRGANIYAEITGYASYSDAYDMTAPAPDLKGRVNTIISACRNASITPMDIDYINAHGTSTPANDINETMALKESLGAHAINIPISSTKSYTGHLISCAGSMESIFCIKAMQSGMVPATINLNNPDPKCDLNYVPNEHLYGRNINVTLNVSFGFGGTNSALVIRKCL